MATPVKQFIFSYNTESDKKVCEIFSDLIAKRIYESPELQNILKNKQNHIEQTKDMC